MGAVSGNHQGVAQGVNWVDGDPDMMLPCWLCRGLVSEKEQWPLPACPSSSSRDNRQFSSSLYVSCVFAATAPVLELRKTESKQFHAHWSFKRNARHLAALLLSQPQSPLVFIAICYRDFSSWYWNPGPEGLVWGWDPLLLRRDLYS